MTRSGRSIAGTIGFCLFAAGTALASHIVAGSPEGDTTLEQKITGNQAANYSPLSLQAANDSYVVRTPPGVGPAPDRATKRVSLAHFSQLTDFQLADEESPARVEFADPGASSAWRPQEAFQPFMVDASIRQVNRFVPASPVPQFNNTGRPMDFALLTGDQADNVQRNEMEWVRDLIEGNGPRDFGSGEEQAARYGNPDVLSKPSCATYVAQETLAQGGNAAAARAAIAAEAALYTGVQDQDDFPAGPPPQPAYYDPDNPTGQYAAFPQWIGLMDRAQTLSFTPAGLDVPSYWSNGNHDVLVQGNEDASAAFEDIATACFKALGTTLQLPPSAPGPDFIPDPNLLLSPANVGMLVPFDDNRRFVSREQTKAVVGATDEGAPGPTDDENHGFAFVDSAENTASGGGASYYAWDPPQTPGFRFINIDTNSEGGQTAEGVASGSANGNIDNPQFEWLTQELEDAQDDDKLIVLFGHHPVRSMTTEIADEQAPACAVDDTDGDGTYEPPVERHPDDTPPHDANPGCDPDPRPSVPVHRGTDAQPGDPRESFVELLDKYPNVIAYVAGHTHEHRLIPFTRSDQSVWWEINTSATADWPQQHRLVDVMDNKDGTLSIFGTVLDAAAPAAAPASGAAGGFDQSQLTSVGRTLAFNDPQGGPPSGEGSVNDRNVEMVLQDPRDVTLQVTKTDAPDPIVAGQQLTYTIDVKNNGPAVSHLTTLTDTLPATVSNVITNAGAGNTCDPVTPDDKVVCQLGSINPGDTETVTIQVTPETAGTITNTAVADSALPNTTSNTASTQTSVTPNPAVNADLSLTKTDSPDPVIAGQRVTYTLTARNGGPDQATGVAITDPLPNGVSLVSATASAGNCQSQSGTVTCTIGTLANGQTATATIVVTANAVGTLTNTASVASGATDPNGANNGASASTSVQLPSGPAAVEPCDGRTPTIIGTDGADTLRGTGGDDVIDARGGDDRANGKGGNDVICGRAGRDRLGGRKGNDRLFGGADADKLKGNKGVDKCAGGPGRDRISRSCES